LTPTRANKGEHLWNSQERTSLFAGISEPLRTTANTSILIRSHIPTPLGVREARTPYYCYIQGRSSTRRPTIKGREVGGAGPRFVSTHKRREDGPIDFRSPYGNVLRRLRALTRQRGVTSSDLLREGAELVLKDQHKEETRAYIRTIEGATEQRIHSRPDDRAFAL